MIKLADILLNEKAETVQQKADNFVTVVDDDIYSSLKSQAKFVINLIKQNKKPSDEDVVAYMNRYMQKYTDINPIISIDTYGVNMVINHLVKDRKKATKVKRFYKSLLDAWMKTKI